MLSHINLHVCGAASTFCASLVLCISAKKDSWALQLVVAKCLSLKYSQFRLHKIFKLLIIRNIRTTELIHLVSQDWHILNRKFKEGPLHPILPVRLKYTGITGPRFQYLKGNNKFYRIPKPWIEKCIDQRVKKRIKIKQTYYKSSRKIIN